MASSTDLWLKPLDLQTLSDEDFKKAYAEINADAEADPNSEAIKLWVAAYKRESLRRGIHQSQKRIRELEDALCASNPYYIVGKLDEDLGSELIHLLGLFSDLEYSGAEIADGAESSELQSKRLELIQVERKCIDTRLNLRWLGNTDAVNDYHTKILAKHTARKTALVAEIKALL